MPGKQRGVRHLVRRSPFPLSHRPPVEHERNWCFQGEHETYWSRHSGNFEHWRFGEGFIQGWDDAYAFFTSSGGPVLPELGYKGAWLKIRERSHVADRGDGSHVWEYSERFFPAFLTTNLSLY